MELIYTNTDHVEQGYLTGFDLDMENGAENDFELTVSRGAWNYLRPGCYIYVEDDTEFGGMITVVDVDTDTSTIKLRGSTWRGLLAAKIIEPPSGSEYRAYTLGNNKSISDIMLDVLTAADLLDLFDVADNTGAVAYQFVKGATVLDGFIALLKDNGLRLKCEYNPTTGKVMLSAVEPVDYSSDDYSSYQFSFHIVKDYSPVTCVIGQTATLIYRAYLQADGTAGTTRYYTGLDERVIYIESSAANITDLTAETQKALLEAQNSTSLEIAIKDIDLQIGDTVSGTEELTNIVVTKTIASKILKMSTKEYSISYRTGE